MVLGGSIGSVYFGVLELTLVSDFYRFIRVLLKKERYYGLQSHVEPNLSRTSETDIEDRNC